jgi:hypothetical protein
MVQQKKEIFIIDFVIHTSIAAHLYGPLNPQFLILIRFDDLFLTLIDLIHGHPHRILNFPSPLSNKIIEFGGTGNSSGQHGLLSDFFAVQLEMLHDCEHLVVGRVGPGADLVVGFYEVLEGGAYWDAALVAGYPCRLGYYGNEITFRDESFEDLLFLVGVWHYKVELYLVICTNVEVLHLFP